MSGVNFTDAQELAENIQNAGNASSLLGVSSQLPGRENGPADALRHLLVSAELTRSYGETGANIILTAKEVIDSNSLNFNNFSAMDYHNNDIGIQIGSYVASIGGTWDDVVRISHELIESSFSGYSPSDFTITNSNLTVGTDGNIIIPQTISLDNGGLAVNAPSVTDVSTWLKNPKDINNNELTNEQSNWPDLNGDWENNFVNEPYDYEGLHNQTPIPEDSITIFDANKKEIVDGVGGSYSPEDIGYAENTSGGITVVINEATTDIGNETYLIIDVIDSVVKAGEEMTGFINKQVGNYLENTFDAFNINLAITNFFSQYGQAIANGNLSAENAAKYFVLEVAESGLDATVADALLSDEMKSLRDTLANPNSTQAQINQALIDAHNDDLVAILDYMKFENSIELSNDIRDIFGQIAIEFALNSSGWNGEDYAKAGAGIITGVVVNKFVASNWGDTLGNAGTQGSVAALTVLGRALIDDGFNQEWGSLATSAALAFGTAYATATIGSAIATAGGLGFASGPALAGAVGATLGFGGGSAAALSAILAGGVALAGIGIVIALAASAAMSALYQGKVYYDGEYGDLSALLNSVYQVQQIDDGNGNMVDALVATNSQGSTIIAQAGITNIIGNAGGDVLVGDSGGTEAEDTLIGNAGSDYLEGKLGNDSLVGGDGNDHISGGEGDDYISGGAGDDLLFGDEGNDTILADDGNDFIHGGRGDDIITAGVGRDLVLGGGGNDTILANEDDDMVDGGAGDDSIDAGAGDDIILGNLGNDVIEGKEGEDVIFGDTGNDNIDGGFDDDFIDGGEGTDILSGNNGNDLINGAAGDDFIDGGIGDDGIQGGAGADTLIGGLDDDVLYGQSGDDILQGGDGDDILIGSSGADILEGGSSSDIYSFENTIADSNNIIEDEDGSNDIISLSWLTEAEANTNLTLTQDSDDLVIDYNGNNIAIITDHFNGKQVEQIEIEQGKTIDLTALTIGTGGVASFAVTAASGGATVASVVTARIDDINANLQAKEFYWNNGFIQNLSEIAYQEALKDQIESEYYNGSETTSFYRNRGKFGGKYTVYKLDVDGDINGTHEVEGVEILQASYNPSDYNSIHTGVTEVVNTATINYYITYDVTVKDYWDGNTLLFSNYEMEILNQATNLIETYRTVYQGDAVEQDELFFSDVVNGNFITHNPAERQAMGSSSTVDVGYKTLQTGADQLVGGYWNEVINGNSGDDILIGNGGDDTINGDWGDDWIFGGDGNDTANGGDGDDSIFGGTGGDNIDGGAGDDAIIAGSGNDTIYGQDGADWIDAGDGVDIIYGGAGDDIIYAGAGDDYAEGGEGIDVIYGQGGNDTIYGNEGTDYLYGEEGDDIIYGVEDEDHIYGGTGYNRLFGNGGVDYIYGGENIDDITGGEGADIIDGGDGFDYVTYVSSSAGVTVDIGGINPNVGGDAEGDVISNVEAVFGSDFDDYIYGNNVTNHLVDRAGNDYVYGRDGDDWLFSVDGTDFFDGGVGSDFIAYGFSGSAVNVSLLTNSGSGGSAENDTYANIENIQGSNHNDTLTGNSSNNVFYGLGGDDTISGGDGEDLLFGNDGVDDLWGSADNDIIYGGADNDILHGGTGNDTLYGEDGGDAIYGNDDDDALYGGLGNDWLLGGNGNDILYGEAGNDTLRGESGNDIIYSLEGDDNIEAGDGDDTIYATSYGSLINGNDGTDTLNYTSLTSSITINLASNIASSSQIGLHSIFNIEWIAAGSGNDIIYGSASNNTIDGYIGDDIIYSSNGTDNIYGGAGDDDFVITNNYAGDGDDIYDGGSGFDTLNLSQIDHMASINTNLGTVWAGYIGSDNISNIEEFILTSYGDSFNGSAANENIIAGSGDDTIYGNGGNDLIFAESGNDIIYGEDGNDTIFAGSGVNIINGNAGIDTIISGINADIIDGGTEFDYVSYASSDVGVIVDLEDNNLNSGGYATGDVLSNIEAIYGSDHNDYIYGNAIANHLVDRAGDDFIYGRDGNDTLFSVSGVDHFDGGNGSDYISYGFSGSAVNVNLTTNTGSGGSAENDTYTNIENIRGSNHNDTIFGNNDDNILRGAGGNDTLHGGTENDNLFGEEGDDTLNGGDGNDNLAGGTGIDNLRGDAGNDIFVFTSLLESISSAMDIILDFTKTEDQIKVTGIANSHTEFSYDQSDGINTIVTDLDSNFSFQINGLHTLDDNDFIFA